MPEALGALRAIVGEAHARAALPADAVDGVAPGVVVTPGSAEEVAAVLRAAADAGLCVIPRGGGSKLGWGAPPARADVVLSTARLDRVLEHAAGDLVVRAQAGVRLDALQLALEPAGQWLALDPPEAGATLGGVVATAASGPRRHRYGTARDLLIGVTVALPDGSVARAGGKVVKNVAGYDLCKLFTGSFGTLGVVVEATFRLHPRPAARRLVIAALASARAAGSALRALLETPLVPSAVELDWPHGSAGGRLAVLFEGVAEGAAAQADQAVALLASHGRAEIVADTEVDEEWRRVAGLTLSPSVRLKIATLPARVADVIEALQAVASSPLRARLGGHAGIGVLFASLAGDDEARLAAAVAEIRRRLPDASVVVLDAAPALKRAAGVWGDPGSALPLMRRVKDRFDPRATLAPGRFVGGI